MGLLVEFDAEAVPASNVLATSGYALDFDGDFTTYTENAGGAVSVTIESGPQGRRGPAGVVVIDADETAPPEGTPVGTIVYQRI